MAIGDLGGLGIRVKRGSNSRWLLPESGGLTTLRDGRAVLRPDDTTLELIAFQLQIEERYMDFRHFEDLEEYEPPGHEGVVNRLLVGVANGYGSDVSIWHGRLEPGGHSEVHTHPESVQIYVGLSGELVVGNTEVEHTLVGKATAVFPAGTKHFIENRSGEAGEVLVVSVPGLR
jgi:quercetin dioxygenase-like cupin family protein